jgi:predicted kinase
MKHLIIIRGLPGAGKTTLANLLAENKYPVFSIDDYFSNSETGAYHFEFSKNHLAYKACEQSVEQAMQSHAIKIFVHNVFSYKWEMEPYFALAQKYNYTVHVITVENYHGNKNTHQISDEQIQKMAEKFKVKLA